MCYLLCALPSERIGIFITSWLHYVTCPNIGGPGPAPWIHAVAVVEARTATHLQWTTIGPASGGCIALTRRMNISSGLGLSGTP